MESVVLVIHLMLALAIIILVLLQRSEGGGLGIGGGGMGAFATPQGAASAMTKATTFCGIAFFCTSMILAIMAGTHSKSQSILDQIENAPVPTLEQVVKDEEKLPEKSSEPKVPISE